MGTFAFSRYAVSIGIAAALLASCGGSQSPIGTPGAMPQSPASATHAARGGSWMLPGAKSGDLLYLSDDISDDVWIFSYPTGKLVGKLSSFSGTPVTLCTDTAGNLYVPTLGQASQGQIYEYAHGGTQPIATLGDPGWPNGCAIDPMTGNLAVANYTGVPYGTGDVAIFTKAQGAPTLYTDPDIKNYEFCAYDNAGNLFVDGFNQPGNIIGELAAGQQNLVSLNLSQSIQPASLQWLDGGLIVAEFVGSPRGDEPIYQVTISGSAGSVSGPVVLSSKSDRNAGPVQFLLENKTLIGPGNYAGSNRLINFWRYPKGGKPKKAMSGHDADFGGVAVSVAPSAKPRSNK